MTTIFDVYTFFRQLTDKAGKGFLRPEDASSWLEAAQLSLFNTYRVSGTLDNITQSALAPFIVESAFTTPSGQFTKPTNFAQALRIVNSADIEHTPVLFNEVRDALRSQLEPIDEYPRYYEGGTFIGLYPQKKTAGRITYYRLPVAPVVGYSNNADGSDVTYNAATSVQLEIPKAYWIEVIIKALPYIGVNLSDSEVYALAQTPQG